jgi:tetratricopeptide (TPR) repeat protein
MRLLWTTLGCLALLSIPLVFFHIASGADSSATEESATLPGTDDINKGVTPEGTEKDQTPLTFEEQLDSAVDLAKMGAFAEAKQEFQDILAKFGEKAIIYYNLGALEEIGDKGRYSGDLNQAIAQYLKCLQLDGNYLSARINLGIIYQKLGYLDMAREQYQKVLQKDPQQKTALFNLAIVLASLNNSEEALGKLSMLIKIDPQDSAAWRAKALLSERIGDIAGAIQAWKQAYTLETNAKWADYDLKRLQSIRGY